MVGYFNNPEATDKVLVDGWLYSGDIALQDEEGFVKIVGRKKSMINSGGFRVQPEEIEEIMLKVNEVDECKVIGLQDQILTEKIVACIVLHPDVKLTDAALFKFLRENLEPEKVPHEIHYLDEFPRGISGKVQVEKLKSIISEKHAAPLAKSEKTLDTVITNAADIFRVEIKDISALSSSSTLSGWDSLNHLALITRLEQVFNVKFSTSDIMVMNSINAILKVINKKLN